MKKILIINGPNLNMLGKREPDQYGSSTLNEIESYTKQKCSDLGVELNWWQSNSESEIIDKIHSVSEEKIDGLIINPAAYSHTSVAILDALKILDIPIVEVHLTNVYNRESFRHSMLTAQASSIIMSGLGKDAYYFAALSLLRD
jgi:3-dehydroquinate dehydratase-2